LADPLEGFAFALLIGVASGAYSSIFIASAVLTHWKECEAVYRHRRQRTLDAYGTVPAGRLTEPQPETVSAAEFEQPKRDIAEDEGEPNRRTSTLTKRLARSHDDDGEAAPAGKPPAPGAHGPRRAPARLAHPELGQATGAPAAPSGASPRPLPSSARRC
jgi:SecD/SecF fusion protein